MFLSFIIRLILSIIVGVIFFTLIYRKTSRNLSNQSKLFQAFLLTLLPAFAIGFNFLGNIALTTLGTREDNVVVARVVRYNFEKKKKKSSAWVKKYSLKIMKGEDEKHIRCEFQAHKDTISTPGNENFNLVVPTYKIGNSVVLEDYCGALLK